MALCHFVDAGADVIAAGSNGNTPLHVETFLGKQDVIRTLSRSGAVIWLIMTWVKQQLM